MKAAVGVGAGNDDAVAVSVRGVIHEVVRVGTGKGGHVASSIYEFQIRQSQQLVRMKRASVAIVNGGLGRRSGRGFRRGSGVESASWIHVSVVDIRVDVIRGQLAGCPHQTTREFLLIDSPDFPEEGKEEG